MNDIDAAGKSLLQRMLDYRNRAEQLRLISEGMHEGAAILMLSIAASYDSAADTAEAILFHRAAA